MDAATLDYFRSAPAALGLYAQLEERLLAAFPDTQATAQRSQIKFTTRGRNFCLLSLPCRRWKGWPEICLILMFGLREQLHSPRIEIATGPYPNRWTHHVIPSDPRQLDDELPRWVAQSHTLAPHKRGRKETT